MNPELKNGSRRIQHAEQVIYPNTLALDMEKYLHYADGFYISEVQRQEFLQVLWQIMSAFVDLGFGVDSVMTILAQRTVENKARGPHSDAPLPAGNVAISDGQMTIKG